MTIKIKVKKDYIMVEFLSGADVWEILDSIEKLFYMDQINNRNIIWLFHEGPIFLIPDDFERVSELFRTNYSPHLNWNKTAIVTEPLFMKGLANKFVNQYRNKLPFKIRVFSDLQDARNWFKE